MLHLVVQHKILTILFVKNQRIDPNKTLFLMDGTAAIYRAYYAVRDLSNSKGTATNAIFGYANIMRKLMKKFDPKYFVVFFDLGKKNFRHDMYEDYKAHRPPTPDDLRSQMSVIKDFTRLLGIKVVEQEGFEADDLIGTAATKAKDHGLNAMMITSDKDMYQVIDDAVVLNYNPNKDCIEDSEAVKEKMGVGPEVIIDYLALCGDASDNIPGVRGVGAKTAARLLNEYGSIEGIYDNIDNISAKALNSKLRENKDNAFLSKKLVTLDLDSPFDFTIDELKIDDADINGINDMLAELEFRNNLIDYLKVDTDSTTTDDMFDELAVITSDLVDVIKSQGEFIYSIFNEELCCLINDRAYRILNEGQVREILTDASIMKVSFNVKESLLYLEDKFKIKVAGKLFDVMVAAFLVNSGLRDLSLKSIDSHFLHEQLEAYSAGNTLQSVKQLYVVLENKLQEDKLNELFICIEMPLINTLMQVQKNPICVDKKYLQEYSTRLHSSLKSLTNKIYSGCQQEFNINSPKQMGRVLFEDLGLAPIKKTKTGFSTNEAVLQKLLGQHPVIEDILEYRKLSKLTSTYIDPFIKQAQEQDGALYPKYSQVSAQTGRLVTFSPNLQNIPVRDKLAKEIRGAFVSAFDGGYLLSADYSQIELRVLAHVSGDDNLITAFLTNRDIHNYTASILFSKKECDVSSQERDFAKRINFAVVYGMSAFGLAKELRISVKQAQEFIDNYFERYQAVKNYVDITTEAVKRDGFVRTCLGRKRVLPDIFSKNKNLRDYAIRQAVNAPIQGAAADIIKIAMNRINDKLIENKIESRMILQIHDELVFDVKAQELDLVHDLVREQMQTAVEFLVPLKVNIKHGKTWLDATK